MRVSAVGLEASSPSERLSPEKVYRRIDQVLKMSPAATIEPRLFLTYPAADDPGIHTVASHRNRCPSNAVMTPGSGSDERRERVMMYMVRYGSIDKQMMADNSNVDLTRKGE
jgi:hypothetical protein